MGRGRRERIEKGSRERIEIRGRSRGGPGGPDPPFCRHVIERDHQQICIAAFMQDA